MNQSWQEKIYLEVAKRSNVIIPYFKYIYFLILIVSLGLGTYFELSGGPHFQFFYDLGRHFGQAALVLLGTVVMPGILGRFGIEIKITRLITVFRRQLGILVFILAFSHYHLVRGVPRLIGLFPLFPPYQLFEYFGTISLFLLFFMFLTSNNFSVKKLGKWWKRLQRIVYVILWLLVLHTTLWRISVWSIFIFFFATLEILSWIYYFLYRSGDTVNDVGKYNE
ncbi:MAG: ferric reductase-like transmembrane domain-containing protein [Candidatus Curtissbacteria bacterium]|nr:ferric reductase-like transmembrane domain-containing protein [Candidatus Curtissbacteria bacterium]